MLDYKKEIAIVLEKAINLKKINKEQIIDLIEKPKNDFGEFSFPCFLLAKELKKKPNEIANELVDKIKKPIFVKKIEVIASYINFHLDYEFIAKDIIPKIIYSDDFGKPKKQGKTIMLEYSSPNPNKEMHVGHLRNNFIGMALINLLEEAGNKVIKTNLINDRGIAICKAMLMYEKFKGKFDENIKGDKLIGQYYSLFQEQAKKNPDLLEEAQELLKKWEAKDEIVRSQWKQLIEMVLDGYKQTYNLIGCKFDKWYFESDYYNKSEDLIEKALEIGLFIKTDDGAILADLEKYGISNEIIKRSDGTSLYVTNDLALTPKKFNDFKLDENYWVVANQQDLYFKQLFKIFEVLGFPWVKKCKHISYGFVNTKEGKMSSRAGNIISADDLIQEMIILTRKEILEREKNLNELKLNERALKIALSALKFTILKLDSSKDLVFDKQEAVSFEGETGPYILYSIARINSIKEKAKENKIKFNFTLKELNNISFKELNSEEERKLIKLLFEFPELINYLINSFHIHSLCKYLIDLAQSFNSFYQKHQVIQAPESLRIERILLIESVQKILIKGMQLLNIETVNRM